mgnify:CR=1 FL=1
MWIQIRTHGLRASRAFFEDTERRAAAALSHAREHVRAVRVLVRDDNGPRGETAWFKSQRGYGEPDNQPKQLFDLAPDPAEHTNQFAAQPEKAAELHSMLVDLIRRGRSTPGAEQANDVEVLIEK